MKIVFLVVSLAIATYAEVGVEVVDVLTPEVTTVEEIIPQTPRRVYGRCELAWDLVGRSFFASLLNDWFCLIEHESSLNSGAVGPPNTDGSQDHGLFQINDRYWCGLNGPGGDCNIACSELTSNNDGVGVSQPCVELIYGRMGLDAWYAWQRSCKGQQITNIAAECGIFQKDNADDNSSSSESDESSSEEDTKKERKDKKKNKGKKDSSDSDESSEETFKKGKKNGLKHAPKKAKFEEKQVKEHHKRHKIEETRGKSKKQRDASESDESSEEDLRQGKKTGLKHAHKKEKIEGKKIKEQPKSHKFEENRVNRNKQDIRKRKD